MAVIKTNISKVYAKARDRANCHTYRKGTRTVTNIPMRIVHFHSGDPSLTNNKECLVVYSKLKKIQVPEKVYETVRLCIIKKISNCFKDITKNDYCINFCKFPHQLLRFHAIASGVRADRISQGMSNSFGTSFMRAGVLKKDEPFLKVYLSSKYEKQINLLKPELKKVLCKVPFTSYVLHQIKN